MSFARIWQSSVERQKWPKRDIKGFGWDAAPHTAPQANFANEGRRIGSAWNHTQHGAHVALVLEVHSVQLLGLVGCFICVSGSWFCQIICTRFPNTFDTVPATAVSPASPWEIILHTYAPRSLDRAGNEPCYWIEKYLRHSTFCAKIQFYFFYIYRRKSAIKRAHTHSAIRPPCPFSSRLWSEPRVQFGSQDVLLSLPIEKQAP